MGWNLDWLLGPRDWSVIDDGMSGGADDVYAVPSTRVSSGDVVVFKDVRRSEARQISHTLQNARINRDMIRMANGWQPSPRTKP